MKIRVKSIDTENRSSPRSFSLEREEGREEEREERGERQTTSHLSLMQD